MAPLRVYSQRGSKKPGYSLAPVSPSRGSSRRQGERGEECWKETGTWGDEGYERIYLLPPAKVTVGTHGLSSYKALEKTLVP